MGMAQRFPMAQQPMRQPMPGHPGFDPTMSSQAGQMPPGNYMQQGQLMSGPQQSYGQPYQQLVPAYMQSDLILSRIPRPNMYGPNAPVRMHQGGIMPQSGMRQPVQGFSGNVPQSAAQNVKGMRQQNLHTGNLFYFNLILLCI